MKDSQRLNIEKFREDLENLYRKKDEGDLEDFEKESPTILKAVEKIYEEIKSQYQNTFKPFNRGGSGIIIEIEHLNLNQLRVLKIPRPKADPSILKNFENEIYLLKNIHHKNAMHIYDSGYVSTTNIENYPFMIIQYIRNPKSLDEYLQEEFLKLNKALDETINNFAEKLYSISKFLFFLHKLPPINPDPNILDVIHGIIHFDIKPDNIQIDENGLAYIIDFGIAKERSEEDKKLAMPFSVPYAHPDFISQLARNTTLNRAITKKVFTPKNHFRFKYDIYSFGRTILNILFFINEKFPNLTSYNYIFIYLHLMACRMLDGENGNSFHSPHSEFLKEEWRDLKATELNIIKYRNFKEIVEDFEKLLIGKDLFKFVPEINNFYPKRIHIGKEGSAPFSEKLKKIVEHPIVARLKGIYQLPFLNNIFPTANHSRLEHSIGVFNNCIRYVQSLYNDPFNPIFKQLCNERDLKSLLLASILHDLGHFPLAHYIEEIFKKVNHEDLTLKYLKNTQVVNSVGLSLADLIEKDWNINTSDIEEILNPSNTTTDLKNIMLNSIISGPVDIDKLDFLRRDSYKCYLKYGEIIDYERLIRNLTIIINTKEKICHFELGIYEKGQIAAESFAFARYCLYQTVYYHHTVRAIRVMIREALLDIPKKREIQKTLDNKGTKTKKKLSEILYEHIQQELFCSAEDILNLIHDYSQDFGKILIKMITSRIFYKRILTIHYEKETVEESLYKTINNLLNNRSELEKLQKKFQDAILKEIIYIKVKDRSDTIYSKEIHEIILEKKLLVKKILLIDIPKSILGIKSTLRLAPEPKRLWNNYHELNSIGEKQSKIYNEIYSNLMNYTAKIRIYCHPDYSKTIMSLLGPENLRRILKSLM